MIAKRGERDGGLEEGGEGGGAGRGEGGGGGCVPDARRGNPMISAGSR